MVYDRRVSRPPQGAEAGDAGFSVKKFSLRTLFLLVLSGAGFAGVVIGLIRRDRSSIVFGYVLLTVACLAYVTSTWHDKKDFPDA